MTIDKAALAAGAPETDLAALNVAQRQHFRDGSAERLLGRLRREAPVHHCPASDFGPYWSITRHADIEAIAGDFERFSSDHRRGGIAIGGEPGAPDLLPMFIAMDPPEHGPGRRAVMPAFSPGRLQLLSDQLRERAEAILDELPVGEPFDWVDRVAIELTAETLALLLGFPREERRRLVRWSDVMTALPGSPAVETMEQKLREIQECFAVFAGIRRRRESAPGDDLISMLAAGPETRSMSPQEFQGNMMLLIVAGNDTTRNSISGSLVALNRFPAEYARLRDDPRLIEPMMPEVIRWQTPVAHMRRTVTRDLEFSGHAMRRGDKVVLWYLSGNRDEAVFERADAFVIDRPNARRHLSFGHGVHRCLGARLAGLQLRILWEALLPRFPRIELAGEPVRTYSTFLNGYESLPVIIPRRLP